jgi:hypothetical protein
MARPSCVETSRRARFVSDLRQASQHFRSPASPEVLNRRRKALTRAAPVCRSSAGCRPCVRAAADREPVHRRVKGAWPGASRALPSVRFRAVAPSPRQCHADRTRVGWPSRRRSAVRRCGTAVMGSRSPQSPTHYYVPHWGYLTIRSTEYQAGATRCRQRAPRRPAPTTCRNAAFHSLATDGQRTVLARLTGRAAPWRRAGHRPARGTSKP